MNWDLQTNYQNGQILLHYAAMLGRAEIVHTLVSEIGINVNVQNPVNGLTALHYAALYTDPLSRIDTIYILIKLGADIDILDNSDHSALDYVEDKRIPHLRYSKEQKIKATELTAPPYNIDMSTLAKLLQVVDSTLNRWIRQHKTEHNIPTKNQQLFQDIKTRPVKALKDGVTQKQTAKQPDISEPAASDRINQYKVDANTHQIILLSHKKNLPIFFEAIDQNDRDKLLTFKDMNWDLQTSYQNGQILLHYASMLGRAEIIHTLVSEIGIDVNVQNPEMGWTALYYAALYTDISSRIDTIHALITLGAKVHVLDNVGYRASYYLEDKEKPLYFKYSIEQKVKAAKLTLPPYNIRITELARILQMNHTTLSNWANQYRDKYNIQTNKPNFQELRAKATKMLKDGLKKSQIAKELDVPKSTVSSWTRQQNKEYNKQVKISNPSFSKEKKGRYSSCTQSWYNSKTNCQRIRCLYKHCISLDISI